MLYFVDILIQVQFSLLLLQAIMRLHGIVKSSLLKIDVLNGMLTEVIYKVQAILSI
jgi:hypothetical protein